MQTMQVFELCVIDAFGTNIGNDNPFIMHEEFMELRVGEGERCVTVSLFSSPTVRQRRNLPESAFQHLPSLGNKVADGVASIALRL